MCGMRDDQLIALRPTLDLNIEDSSEIEAFQNKTLRPILKLQHPFTMQLLANSAHFQKMKENVDIENEKAYTELVSKYFNSNIVFKNKIIGSVIGLLTQQESDYYYTESSELNKRISTMQIQRFVDSRND